MENECFLSLPQGCKELGQALVLILPALLSGFGLSFPTETAVNVVPLTFLSGAAENLMRLGNTSSREWAVKAHLSSDSRMPDMVVWLTPEPQHAEAGKYVRNNPVL